MTLVQRTFVALCIALATALAVAGLAIMDADRAPDRFERTYQD